MPLSFLERLGRHCLLLGALILLLSSCNDHHDVLDCCPGYWGPTGGQHHKAGGADEDYCGC